MLLFILYTSNSGQTSRIVYLYLPGFVYLIVPKTAGLVAFAAFAVTDPPAGVFPGIGVGIVGVTSFVEAVSLNSNPSLGAKVQLLKTFVTWSDALAS